MAMQQGGAPQGAEQQSGAETRPAQMGAASGRTLKAPVQAAFGTSSGAAVVFRDFASI